MARMTNTALSAENISKMYRLGNVGTGSLRDDLARTWARVRGQDDPFQKIGETNDRTAQGSSDYVWAVKDVSFEVKPGEVLGVVGRNGAGKSTLLKILSRVTTPSTGKITLHGRVASLLEVGTGFHPELTGRENIFLNGAILGMRRHEIKRKFDEIVAFAGVERYIDTPVKRYSSGMYVRLAFAVAAHLEPEILIVDEVLAVGDAEFQKKCLGKMKDVSSGEGRTVLFVSHNMAAVKSLCDRAILMEHGRLTYQGQTDDVVTRYLRGGSDQANHKTFTGNELSVEGLDVLGIGIRAGGKDVNDPIREGEQILIETSYALHADFADRYTLTYHLYNELGEAMFSFSHSGDGVALQPGRNTVTCEFPARFLNTGTFYLSLFLVVDKSRALRVEKDVASFTVSNAAYELGTWMGREPGYLKPGFTWTHKPLLP